MGKHCPLTTSYRVVHWVHRLLLKESKVRQLAVLQVPFISWKPEIQPLHSLVMPSNYWQFMAMHSSKMRENPVRQVRQSKLFAAKASQ